MVRSGSPLKLGGGFSSLISKLKRQHHDADDSEDREKHDLPYVIVACSAPNSHRQTDTKEWHDHQPIAGFPRTYHHDTLSTQQVHIYET